VLQHNLPEASGSFNFMRISELIEARRLGEASPEWGNQLTTLESTE